MDNEQLLDLLQNRPKGLLEQLKYFEYELSKLEKQKGNSEIKRRIRSEIDNLRYDISVFDEILNESKPKLESIFYSGQQLCDKSTSVINSELDNLPKKELFGYAVFTGVSLSLLIVSLNSQDYILLIASLLFLVSAYLFYRKSKLIGLINLNKEVKETTELLTVIEDEMELREALKQEIFFAQKRNDTAKNSNSHFEYKDWLEKKVLEFEAKGETQNKALEKTRELYEKEFDRKPPAKITILRYMGRAD